MSPFHILFLLFLGIPLLEIYLLIKVGSVIGAFTTVFLVVFTAVLGAWLLRIQGFSTLTRVRTTLEQGGIPAVDRPRFRGLVNRALSCAHLVR